MTVSQQVGEVLAPAETAKIRAFFKRLRADYGESWGFILDLRDNISQVLRCVISDTGQSGLVPVENVPLIAELSWRVTALEHEKPIHFERVNMEDPRSFYLRKTVGPSQLTLFPIKSDSNIGVLTMFDTQALPPLDHETIMRIDKRVQKNLVTTVGRIIWELEQQTINTALAKIRERESPIFICQLFNRLLDLPILFAERTNGDNYESVRGVGLIGKKAKTRFNFKLAHPANQTFLSCQWVDISNSRTFPNDQPMTVIFLAGGQALLAFGELKLTGKNREDVFHYIGQVELLLAKPPHQISTLNFMLHLQHWIRSDERDIGVVFQYIVDMLVRFLDADFGTLALLERDNRNLVLVSQAGTMTTPVRKLALDNEGPPESILAWAALHNKPYLAPDVRRDPFYKPFHPEIRSELAVPIQARGEMIGLFSISSRHIAQFKKADIQRLTFFADQIGTTLLQAGILEKAFAEDDQKRKLDQDIKFGFHQRTHAKNLTYHFGNLVGHGEGGMAGVYEAIRKINQSGRDDLNVLITGETGCGKEMVAFALHNSSGRSQHPMVIANFASFGGDPNLIQSELFGHEKGSFSGATNRRIGCIEQANASTLLIDEVGDIVSSVQIKLLRVLQQGAEKTFQRLGGQNEIRSNVRVLAATHKDLRQAVEQADFREDLFYRLQTLVIRIPPLRERLEDIPLLASHLGAKYERAAPGTEIRWTDEAILSLQDYDWPGNVRQLEAVINRALVLFAEDHILTGEAVARSLDLEQPHAPRRDQSLFNRICGAGEGAFWHLARDPYRRHELTHADLLDLIRQALETTRGSYKQAAAMMGVGPEDYNRFLHFLKNSNAKPDYRPFRVR